MKIKAVVKRNFLLFKQKEYYGTKVVMNDKTHKAFLYGIDDTQKFGDNEADFYIMIDGKWCLFDHNLPISNRYNQLLLKAQKEGFKNVFEYMQRPNLISNENRI